MVSQLVLFRWAPPVLARGRVRLQVSVDRLAPVDSVAESHRMLQEMKWRAERTVSGSEREKGRTYKK